MKGDRVLKNMFVRRSALMLCVAFASFVMLTGCGKEEKKLSFELGDMPDVAQDSDADIDIDSLNEAADAIRDLDLSQDNSDYDADSGNTKEAEDEKQTEGELTEYSYTDVVRAGNDITVTPNGGLNASTELYDGKDLGGFLDYVDDSVLEKGRTINRDLFYDLLATMLVDKDLSSDFDQIEKNMLMALAVANNFHDVDVKIIDCNLDANNAAEYRYNVNAFGTDDTWIVNYGDRTFYMNDGATEYHSDMFEDKYLAVWMVAIEEYYLD